MYNLGMKELMDALTNIGFSPDICEQIQRRFEGDFDGLRRYVIYCVAMYGDRNERMD